MKKVLLAAAMVLCFVSVGLSAQFGVAEVSTDVPFDWTANTESDLAGYYIYRSSESGVYDETKRVLTISPTEVAAVDVGVPDGEWFWVITAFDTAGNENAYSPEVTAILDTDPPAPVQNFRIVPTILVPLVLD